MSSRKPIYKGRVVDLGLETARLPTGEELEIEIVRHPGGAAVAALDTDGRVCLIRQYRHATGDWLWELPAGKIDPGEAPESTACRELAEEAGLTANDWTSLGRMWSTPGFCDEVIHLYLARDLSEVPHDHQDDELIEVHWLPFEEAVQRAIDGRLDDAKTVIALLRADALLTSERSSRA